MSAPTAAGAEAAALLAALHARAFADAAWSAEAMMALLASPGVFARVAGEGEGFVLARAAAGEGEILTLAVAPAARRRGLGRSLVLAAAEACAAAGARTLFLEVAADNAAALALYAACGFRPSGVRRGYYRRAEGAPVDALTLSLALNTPSR